MSNEMLLWIVLLAVAVAIVCLILLLLRKPDAAMERLRDQLESALRDEQRGGRGELRDSLEALGRGQSQHHAGLDQKVNALTERTDRRLDEFRLSLAEEAHKTRAAALEQQKVFADSLGQRLSELTQGNEQRMGEADPPKAEGHEPPVQETPPAVEPTYEHKPIPPSAIPPGTIV